jgi:predicted permease
MFAEQLEHADGSQRFSLWMRAAWDALTVAPREHWHVIRQDVRYAFRILAARPSFTIVAVLSLALGIGANTAIFSLWNGVLRAQLPLVRQPGELVMLTNPDDQGSWSGRWDGREDGPRSWLSYEEFRELRDRATSFSGLMASQSSLADWQARFDDAAPELIHGRLVSGEFFQVLGVNPAIGRAFTPAGECAAMPCAVLSHQFWQRRFEGRPGVLGKSFTIRQTTLTVVGVMPPGFIGETSGQQPDVWLPLHVQAGVLPGVDRLHDTPPNKMMWLQVFGRLKPGVTMPQAEAESNAIFTAGLESFYGAALTAERRAEFLDQRLALHAGARGASSTRRQFSDSLTALLVAVGVLLLIACANLANLLIARGAARRPEIALRLSLGASRERIVRQLVTESVVLAAMGGAVAIAVAYALQDVLVRKITETDSDFAMSFSIGPAMLLFVAAATLLAALLFGLLPAWQITGGDTAARLNEQSRGGAGSFGRLRSGRLLVSLQLALSLPLLIGAGLLARTVYNLQRADLGFPTDRTLLARVDLRDAGYVGERADGALRELVDRIKGIPGVRTISYSQLGLFTGGESSETIEVEGAPPRQGADRSTPRDVVGPGYFAALGVPITLGRDIAASDGPDSPRVCVVNEAFVRRYLDGRNPIGLHVSQVNDSSQRTPMQIVGVARDARTQRLRDEVKPRFYLAARQTPKQMLSPTMIIQTAGEPAALLATVRATIQRLDAALRIFSAGTLEEAMVPLTAQDRTMAQLAVVFGAVALALAAIGLYGVLACGIARRTAEIGIRIALGARPGRVIGMILRETAGVVAVGLGIGGIIAYGASSVIASRLYGIAVQDPATLTLATLTLVAVALGAAFVPAHRASKLNPIMALRQA